MDTSLLKVSVAHHVWASRRLLEACRQLSDEQLRADATGTYGSVLATLEHLVRSDGGYLARLVGTRPDWVSDRGEASIRELEVRVDDAERLWDTFLAAPIDPERVIVIDDGANECFAGVFVAQALHHGNAHREQVCAILTGLGIEPPDLQPWEYAWATGRLWVRSADD